MERYKWVIARDARTDMQSIAYHITHEFHAPGTAKSILSQIRREILSLQTMPERYALARDEALARQGYRVTSVGNYLLFYTVDKAGKTVRIMRVLHGSRRWENLL